MTDRNYPELFYKILKECAENPWCNKGILAQKFNISESDNTFKYMIELSFISDDNGIVKILPQGISTYLAISSQKQANEQARKATIFAIWAIGIGVTSLLASIIFNLLSFLKQ